MSKSYPTRHLTLKQKKAIFNKAKKVCIQWWADVLDCNVSFLRQRIEVPWEEMLAKMTDKTHFVIILRENTFELPYLQISYRTMEGEPDYFLWVDVDPKFFDKIVPKSCMKETE